MRSKTGQCKHFKGIQYDECEAKINIREITGGDNLGWARRMPCFEGSEAENNCESYSEPTKEEIEADELSMERKIQEVMMIMPLVGEWKKKHKNGGNGIVTCPICKGYLQYSISSYNGHCHAQCNTDNCVSFME